MPTKTFSIKKGDVEPALKVTFADANGVTKDLTGHTIKFIMQPYAGGAVKINLPATITDAVNGKVEYRWAGTDTDTADVYKAEFQATETATSRKSTYPSGDYIQVSVFTDIGD